MPKSSSNNLAIAAIAAIRDLTHALRNPTPASPLPPLTDSIHAALLELDNLFNTAPAPFTPSTQSTTSSATPDTPLGFAPLPRVVTFADTATSQTATHVADPDPVARPRVTPPRHQSRTGPNPGPSGIHVPVPHR
jgi:hypothetical protein